MKLQYLLINYAIDQSGGIPLIDLYLGQYNQDGEDVVVTTPAAYIEFDPIEWQTYPGRVQKGTLQFKVHLVLESLHGSDQDILDDTYVQHEQHMNTIYRALHGRSLGLGTFGYPDPIILLEGIVRTRTEYHHTLNNLIVTIQTFQARTHDFAAMPNYIEVMADIQTNYMIKPRIT